jgi:hypothetical protein
MSKPAVLTLFILCSFLQLGASPGSSNQIANAVRTQTPPKIDGVMDDACWADAMVITGFKKYDPDYGQPATQKTFVHILYDDEAIYIGARLMDSAPDSILKQLGNRDDGSLNADWFGVQFDTYHNRLDGYTFRVTASGVQIDSRVSDWTYDAVWQSKVEITNEGWVVEMMIPYSAIRFPAQTEQIWGLQLQRYIRRHRENATWALGVRGMPNQLAYWGTLTGLSNIEPPLRLSLTPYFSISGQHDETVADVASQFSYSFGGGADLKIGINESYTLDMTLFPDFSQVKSDDKVKNLSAFEVVYAEQRPFFKEGVDLFRKGGLFYSRRVGQTPRRFNEVPDLITDEEVIIENPSQAKLVNATKVSGRNKNGLAIGLLNAITNNTYAVAENEAGQRRRILTEPFTNFNILVFDQALANNSSAYLINTSVLRSGEQNDAFVTGAGINIYNPQNTYRINASGAISQKLLVDSESDNATLSRGYKYYATTGKVSGNFQYSLYRSVMNDTYDDNDLGLTHRNNFVKNGLNLRYYIFDPFWKIRSFNSYIYLNRETDFTTKKNINTLLRYGASATFLNYYSAWFGMSYSIFDRYDYYDPRTEGRFIIRSGYINGDIGFSTDYRNPFALDGGFWMGYDPDGYFGYNFRMSPRVRVSDKLFFDYSLRFNYAEGFKGYVTKVDSLEQIIYGDRVTESLENTMTGRYIFQNNLSLSLWMRHYWYKGFYENFFNLEENGRLSVFDFRENHDFNFNTFNIDLIFNWEFAPGSNLSLVWKNAILTDENEIIDNFLENFRQSLQAEQLNQISLKILYYLDYSTFLRGRNNPAG